MPSERATSKKPTKASEIDNHREEARSWMIERLEAHFVILSDDESGTYLDKQRDLAVTRQIIAKVTPEAPLQFNEDVEDWVFTTRLAIERTLGVLQHQREIERYLGPDGPKMAVDQLHPVIWNAAAELWNNGHYREAVSRAATFLNAHVQDQAMRTDISDKALMNEAFSALSPAPGKPRLVWVGATHGLTETSMREGIRSYAVGVSMAIRNPAVHETDGMPKQEAVEQLAAMSVLARWIEGTELDLHEDDPDPNM